VVTRAAKEADGHGFVTEFAGNTTDLGAQMVFEWEEQEWSRISTTTYPNDLEMIRDTMQNFGAWDGYDDALRTSVTLPETISYDDFMLCPACYLNDPESEVVFDRPTFLEQVFATVIAPMLATRDLVDDADKLTRLYTTMSAEDMTVDPLFNYNADLDDVSNIHTAEQFIACDDNDDWYIELAQGDTIRGETARVWPVETGASAQPGALRILQFGTSGAGDVIDDQSSAVTVLLSDEAPGSGATPGSDREDGDVPMATPTGSRSSGGGCRLSTNGASQAPVGAASAWLLALLGIAVWRRRR
jgi:hypothetical protein